ncbi:MAG: class I SAM-dependent methyltransferase [Spirosomaceae bacterium]|nr:class I SAM-dependent methyltransferase [Spirosomataceae bacterium]
MNESDVDFIQSHLQADTKQLLLKYGKAKEALIHQIEARQKARTKLPAWYAEPHLVFPAGVSVEQSSSEITAHYKAEIVAQSTDSKSLIDATGGMGVDSFYLAKSVEQVTYLERNEALVACARHNFERLNALNITCVCTDSMAYLENLLAPVDWLYLDPARRASDHKRVVALTDCDPDVLRFMPLLLQKTQRILLKTAPLLDLKQALQQLPQTTTVHVVAVENECKEVLFEMEVTRSRPRGEKKILTKAINFKKDGTRQVFTFEWQREQDAQVTYQDPQQYLYEPNAAVLKSGAFRSVSAFYQLPKIAVSSHLYTSENLRLDFPGRIFRLKAVVKTDAKALAPWLKDGKANLTVRNFPATVEELRKKLKLKEGGDTYIFATTLSNGDKRLLVCEKAVTEL